MPKIKYKNVRFSSSSRALIEKANEIIESYKGQGFDLTLRQLYYQFVSRDIIANTQKEYKRIGAVINDARLAGLIDWDSIVDRTRNLQKNPHWDSPSEIVESCAEQYREDLWAGQDHRVEVWIEKDALSGVISGICTELDTPYFSCRGYTSQSEMWGAAQRLRSYATRGQTPVIIHLGDHDPSGKDMTRDIMDRMRMFVGKSINVKRIALNMDQIEKYNPPPNPAKITDSRATGYIHEFGSDSWELDALEPQVITKLVEKTVLKFRDDKKWRKAEALQGEGRRRLREVARDV